MRKNYRRISVVITILSLSVFCGCQTTKTGNNLQGHLDDLQKQIFELQQDHAYVNTKVEQVSGRLSKLQEQIENQEGQIKGIREGQERLEEDIKMASIQPEKEIEPSLPLTPKETTEISHKGHRDLYNEALDHIKSGDIDPAIPLLRKHLEIYPRTELADNAQYWLGECYYKKKDYNKAIQEFKKVLSDYPNGNKIPAALLKMGYAYYELGQTTQALESLNQIIKQHPDEPVYPLAKKKIDIILSER